jgi:Protein of unknown function (DUF2892)
MKKNVGIIDRAIRILLALVLVSLYASGIVTGTIGIILLVLAVVFAATAIIRFCPLYLPFGISTWGKKK